MIDKIRNLVLKLEKEDDIYTKCILSNIISSYYKYLLSENDKKILEKELENVLLYDQSNFYDTLFYDANTHIEISDKVISTYHEAEFDSHFYKPKKKLNKKESDEIIREILSDMDSDIYELYKDLENKKRIVVKPLKEEAVCINGFNLDDDYIVINSNIHFMIEFILTKNHEIGHIYEISLMKDLSQKQKWDRYKYNYSEVVSRFFERVSMDYMINNDIYKNETENFLFSRYADLLCDFLFLDKIIYHIKNDMCTYNNENYLFTKKIDYEEIEDRFIFDVSSYGSYRKFTNYGYGSLLGEYFFSVYKENKKEGLKSLKEFVLRQGLLNNQEMLRKINFYNNDLSFLKNGINDNLSYFRNRHK